MKSLLNSMLLLQHTIQSSMSYLFFLSLFLLAMLYVFRFFRPYLVFLGIIPRKWFGVLGIFTSPFIHADFNHYFFNLFPLIILSAFLMVFGFDFYLNISVILIVLSGTLIWCFARPGVHIGASALITAYWGFLVTEAFLGGSDNINNFIGFICLYYFTGIFFGIFPREEQVSWEGHLLGLISGVGIYIAAYYIPAIHHQIFDRPYPITLS